MDNLCGCGLPVKYFTLRNGDISDGSCNKYARCLTYEELKSKLQKTEGALTLYANAINKIDDYFEYRCNSEQDRREVYKTLGNLTDKIGELYASDNL